MILRVRLGGCSSKMYSGLIRLENDRRSHDNPRPSITRAFLQDWTGGQDMRLCVATTHLLFNPKRGDIKLAQLAVLLAELDRFTRKGIEPGTGMPLYHPRFGLVGMTYLLLDRKMWFIQSS